VELSRVIAWRRSIRRFSKRPIEKEEIIEILEAARRAPSSSNSQPWHFIVVDDTKKIGAIVRAAPFGTKSIISFARDAQVLIVCCYKKKITHHLAQLFGHDNHLIDVAIATDHLVLRATDLGIGSCWIGWFDEKKVKRLLDIPRNFRIAVMVALGYPEGPSTDDGIGGIQARPRKSLSEISSYNSFRDPFI